MAKNLSNEAMKRLTLHRIASLFHRFIASGAQVWLQGLVE
jgi:hypothetical protein